VFSLWQRAAVGLDMRKYTNKSLQFLGAVNVGAWFCRADQSTESLEFGVTRQVVGIPSHGSQLQT
jgi:hypothetical protein